MERDDLFTHIHKGLRRGLFDLAVAAGATDWTDPAEAAALDERWQPLLDLLRGHTDHEDRHILRILDGHDPTVTVAVAEEHRDLDDLLDAVAVSIERAVESRDPVAGLDAYRDINRFIAGYLPHLHVEETVVMTRIWELCGDEEIAATRAAFMADITPPQARLSVALMLPALDKVTRTELLARLPAAAVSA